MSKSRVRSHALFVSRWPNAMRLMVGSWTAEQRNGDAIANFKNRLPHGGNLTESNASSPLAFLCVRSMLMTAFDAPLVQVLYLNRSIKDHALLQAIARFNGVQSDKTC